MSLKAAHYNSWQLLLIYKSLISQEFCIVFYVYRSTGVKYKYPQIICMYEHKNTERNFKKKFTKCPTKVINLSNKNKLW